MSYGVVPRFKFFMQFFAQRDQLFALEVRDRHALPSLTCALQGRSVLYSIRQASMSGYVVRKLIPEPLIRLQQLQAEYQGDEPH